MTYLICTNCTEQLNVKSRLEVVDVLYSSYSAYWKPTTRPSPMGYTTLFENQIWICGLTLEACMSAMHKAERPTYYLLDNLRCLVKTRCLQKYNKSTIELLLFFKCLENNSQKTLYILYLYLTLIIYLR